MNTSLNQNLEGVSAPVLRKILPATTEYTPAEDVSVIIGSDITITVDGNSLDVLQNMSFILVKDVTYTFSDNVVLGIS